MARDEHRRTKTRIVRLGRVVRVWITQDAPDIRNTRGLRQDARRTARDSITYYLLDELASRADARRKALRARILAQFPNGVYAVEHVPSLFWRVARHVVSKRIEVHTLVIHDEDAIRRWADEEEGRIITEWSIEVNSLPREEALDLLTLLKKEMPGLANRLLRPKIHRQNFDRRRAQMGDPPPGSFELRLKTTRLEVDVD